MKCIAALIFALSILSACQQPEPRTNVDVMREGAIVDVQTRRSDVYVGEEGIQVNTPGSRVDISEGGIRITD